MADDFIGEAAKKLPLVEGNGFTSEIVDGERVLTFRTPHRRAVEGILQAIDQSDFASNSPQVTSDDQGNYVIPWRVNISTPISTIVSRIEEMEKFHLLDTALAEAFPQARRVLTYYKAGHFAVYLTHTNDEPIQELSQRLPRYGDKDIISNEEQHDTNGGNVYHFIVNPLDIANFRRFAQDLTNLQPRKGAFDDFITVDGEKQTVRISQQAFRKNDPLQNKKAADGFAEQIQALSNTNGTQQLLSINVTEHDVADPRLELTFNGGNFPGFAADIKQILAWYVATGRIDNPDPSRVNIRINIAEEFKYAPDSSQVAQAFVAWANDGQKTGSPFILDEVNGHIFTRRNIPRSDRAQQQAVKSGIRATLAEFKSLHLAQQTGAQAKLANELEPEEQEIKH